MTLEEAKKQIEEDMNGCWKAFAVSRSSKCKLEANILHDVLTMLEDVEPAGIPDRLTLEELARELKRLFRFRYLTAHRSGVEIFLRMYAKEPSYVEIYSVWGNQDTVFFPIAVSEDLRVDLDLSEYADENGVIDYSRCIVEVLHDVD